jgi:hypothetical protein
VQNIAWTASTTAAVFFALNASSLPGLSQLGNLVGIGVIIGAGVMLGIFAPLTTRFHRHAVKRGPTLIERWMESRRFLLAGAWGTALLIVGLVAATLSTIAVPYTLTGTFILKSGARVQGSATGIYTGSNSHDLTVTFIQQNQDTKQLISTTKALAGTLK